MKPNLGELLGGQAIAQRDVCALRQLMTRLGHPGTETERDAAFLALDTSLSAHTLNVLNSPYYALPIKLNALSEANAVLGFQCLVELILAVKVTEHFGLFYAEESRDAQFWQNSLYAASVARDLYRALGHKRHNLFAITLLHHLGALIFQQRLPQQMATIMRTVRRHKSELCEVEHATLGYSHAEVGAELMERWGLPGIFIEVTRHHHDFAHARHFAVEAAVVYLADSVAQQYCPLTHSKGVVSKPKQSVFRYVTLPQSRLQRLYQTVQARRCGTSVLRGEHEEAVQGGLKPPVH